MSEAPSYGQPITVFDPDNRGAQAYRDLANEVLGNEVDLDEPPAKSAPAPGVGIAEKPAGDTLKEESADEEPAASAQGEEE